MKRKRKEDRHDDQEGWAHDKDYCSDLKGSMPVVSSPSFHAIHYSLPSSILSCASLRVKERHKTRRSSSSWTIESLFQSIVKRSSLSSSASSGHGRHQWYSSRTHETSGSIIILQTSVRICNREMISEKFSRQNYNHLWKDRQENWIERKLHESLMRLIP